MAVSKKDADKAHSDGQKAYNDGRGRSSTGHGTKILESWDDDRTRQDIYKKGYENARDQDK